MSRHVWTAAARALGRSMGESRSIVGAARVGLRPSRRGATMSSSARVGRMLHASSAPGADEEPVRGHGRDLSAALREEGAALLEGDDRVAAAREDAFELGALHARDAALHVVEAREVE